MREDAMPKWILVNGKRIDMEEKDAKRIEKIVDALYHGGVIPNLARKPALDEALVMAYELGYNRREEKEGGGYNHTC
jgi:hypothetical protein